DVDGGIESVLAEVGRFVGAERAFVYLFTEAQTARLAYAWNAPGRVVQTAAEVPIASFPWTMGRMRPLDHVHFATADLPYDERAQLVGRNADLLVAYPSDIELMHAKMHLREQGYSDQYAVRVRRKDDTVIWLEIGGAPVYDAAGRVVGSIGVHNDVTQRRLAE